jgi:hypothetical protein
MQRRAIIVILTGIVAAIAIAAVAFGPGVLRDLSSPGSNPNRPGNGSGPSPTSFDVPTWHVGDSWTYQTNASSGGLQPDGPTASGNLTRTVVSAGSSQYNVSLDGSFHIRWMIDPTPMASPSGAAAMMMCRGMFDNATLSGYTWYQASDLAVVKEVRTVNVHGSSMTSAGIYDASYSATVETTFEPALKVWSFPLQANQTWTATSNATVTGWIQWHLSGPNASWSDRSNFTFHVPVRLSMMSGEEADIVTPAGTFAAIPVSIGHPELDVAPPGMTADPVDRAMGFDHEMPIGRDHATQAWFSGAAKNVVKAEMFEGGMRLNLVLRSYHLG